MGCDGQQSRFCIESRIDERTRMFRSMISKGMGMEIIQCGLSFGEWCDG